jgi:hypothetical protein
MAKESKVPVAPVASTGQQKQMADGAPTSPASKASHVPRQATNADASKSLDLAPLEGAMTQTNEANSIGGASKTRHVVIRLGDLPNHADEHDDLYDLRAAVKYTKPNLSELIQNLRFEKQLNPIRVFKQDGKWRVIAGHRRVRALFELVEENADGFSLDMEVRAEEILHASHEDLLVYAVSDNEQRESFDAKERLLIVQKFSAANVSVKRAAVALGISEKTYKRDERLASNECMLQFVLDDKLSPSAASGILDLSEKTGRTDEFCVHFEVYSEDVAKDIDERDRVAKAQGEKGLKPAELLVKNNIPPRVINQWLSAFASGKPFTAEDTWNFRASLDKKTGQLRIDKVTVDVLNDPLPMIAKTASKLSQITKRVLAMLQVRYEREVNGSKELAIEPIPYDLEALKALGMEDLATLLERDLQAEESSDDTLATDDNDEFADETDESGEAN